MTRHELEAKHQAYLLGAAEKAVEIERVEALLERLEKERHNTEGAAAAIEALIKEFPEENSDKVVPFKH